MSRISSALCSCVVVGLSIGALSSSMSAQTVVVTISSGEVDINWQTGTIAELPGPDGEVSFSEAIIATNNTPGHQTIAFNIPQSKWTMQFLYPGRAVLIGGGGFYNWTATDEVTIDGTTQTAFTGDTYAGGNEVARLICAETALGPSGPSRAA